MRSRRTRDLVQSDIRAMTQRCRELGGVNMGQGICDTPPPPDLLREVMPAIEAGHNTYSRFDGVAPLREILAAKLAAYNGMTVDPETELVVTLGSTGAFAATLTALCDPGDRLLLFEPYYGYHLNTARVVGLEPVLVPLGRGDFALDVAALEAAAPGARAIVVNTPGNPSGRVFSRRELQTIAEVCQRHDLLCITDEIYEYFLYDGRPHISLATLPGMAQRTVTISGYSKTFSITGWRIGYAAAPRALATAIGLVADLYYACAPTPLQHAVAGAIAALGEGYYSALAKEYQAKRDQFCGVLAEVGLSPHVPEGAYYVLAETQAVGCASAADAAMRLLEDAGVAGIPGTAFYQSPRGEELIRFCYGKEQAALDQAGEQLLAWHRAGS